MRQILIYVLLILVVGAGISAQAAPKVQVTFEGMFAFVETTKDSSGRPTTLDALVIDVKGIDRDQLPEVVNESLGMQYPVHLPFISLDRGILRNCSFKGISVILEIPDSSGQVQKIEAFPLCENIDCKVKPLSISVGAGGLIGQFNLDELVDKRDLNPGCDSPDYLKLDGGLAKADTKVVARLRIRSADSVEARPIPNSDGIYADFGYRNLEKYDLFPSCSSCVRVQSNPRLLAEEVVASGTGDFEIELNGRRCQVVPDAASSIRLRFLNVPWPQHLGPHYDTFLHFHDLSAGSCFLNERNFPVPCVLNTNAGDPKCPQVRLWE